MIVHLPIFHPYLSYYLRADTKYRVHSPFVFEFVREVLEDDRQYHAFWEIETYQRNLLRINDLVNANGERLPFGKVAQKQRLKKRTGQWLFQSTNLYQPNHLLQIGWGTGVAALYQASVRSHAQLICVEPNVSLVNATDSLFQSLPYQNIRRETGHPVEGTQRALAQLKTVEQVFFNDYFDEATTLQLFDLVLARSVSNTVVIFHRPHATATRRTVWKTVRHRPEVRLSIDIYELGFLFFRHEQKARSHYQLIEQWRKPWVLF